ncbi:YraN family protein [Paludibacterium yongneupense]|uniref:YraN family protein n=1 Tax=Paludibacterium yongneupense TaxID=400061 RepID=UPI0003F851DA|nr:YraN family protein [Paludibacterium yongneupense]
MNSAGRAAEDRALVFLQQHGLRLVERNWCCRGGEIDLVMRDGAVWVLVEVRHRSASRFGGALASITPAKCRRLRLAANAYCQARGVTDNCRFDAVVSDGESGPVWLKNIQV